MNAEPLQVVCPSCHARFPLRDRTALGSRIMCRNCNQTFVASSSGDLLVRDKDLESRGAGPLLTRARRKKSRVNARLVGISSLIAATLLITGGMWFGPSPTEPADSGTSSSAKTPSAPAENKTTAVTDSIQTTQDNNVRQLTGDSAPTSQPVTAGARPIAKSTNPRPRSRAADLAASNPDSHRNKPSSGSAPLLGIADGPDPRSRLGSGVQEGSHRSGPGKWPKSKGAWERVREFTDRYGQQNVLLVVIPGRLLTSDEASLLLHQFEVMFGKADGALCQLTNDIPDSVIALICTRDPAEVAAHITFAKIRGVDVKDRRIDLEPASLKITSALKSPSESSEPPFKDGQSPEKSPFKTEESPFKSESKDKDQSPFKAEK
jgi:hypothetical protein